MIGNYSKLVEHFLRSSTLDESYLGIIDAAEGAPQLSCDSQINLPLEVGDVVKVGKSEEPLNLLYPAGHSFYESCRSKLDWASRLGGSE